MNSSNSDSNIKRWNKAQSAEKKYWKSSKAGHQMSKETWRSFLKSGFDLDFDFFKDKDVLEIGAGPNGIIYRITEAKSRIGIEPMDLSGIIEDWKKVFVKMGKAEDLPFSDNSFDVVICFNVLDHSLDPDAILSESKRVLREKGVLLFQMIVLRNQYKIFRPILNKIDSPHPYHLTSNEIISMITKYFTVNKKRIFRGLGWDNKYRYGKSFKFFAGNYIMKNLILVLEKN